jgi:hypothetical protein
MLLRYINTTGTLLPNHPSSFVSLTDILNFPVGISQRYTEITHDPLLFSVAQGIF